MVFLVGLQNDSDRSDWPCSDTAMSALGVAKFRNASMFSWVFRFMEHFSKKTAF